MRTRIPGVAVVVFVTLLSAGHSPAADGLTALDVEGEQVRIHRDDFGVPHVFAETNHGLFVGYGYTVAEDRLWQLEVNRRSARGTLAAIFGAPSLAADRTARTFGYTDAQLDAQLAELSPQDQALLHAYVEGINRYITEVVAPDPAHKLPFEFHNLNLGVPAVWTVQDVVAFAVFEARLFMERGGGELANQNLLNFLIGKFGSEAGRAAFDDVAWVKDPESPVSVPRVGAIGKRQKAEPGAIHPGQIIEGPDEDGDPQEQARAIWESLGVPTKVGSHGWVISPSNSANGAAMLFGAPQVRFNAPEWFHEVQLKGGDFNVAGVTFSGLPFIMIGRTPHLAWSIMTPDQANTVDTYAETLCGGGTGYLFNGACTPFENRIEVIKVKGQADVIHTVQRSVHGPVIALGPGVRFTQKSAQAGHELGGSIGHFLAFNRAHNIGEFERILDQMIGGFHFVYADKTGNIAYWMASRVPRPPAGFDTRLPLPGTGIAEWTTEVVPVPRSINPTRGWLANWNTMPSADYPFGGQKQSRLQEIEDAITSRLAIGPLTVQDMKDIEMDVSRDAYGGAGRQSRYLKPYLLAALDAFPPQNPLAPRARAVLESWDGMRFPDAVNSTTLDPGFVIFDDWLSRMLRTTFADDLGATFVGRARPNMLLHVLDEVLGEGSALPPSRDYFNGADPRVVMAQAFDQTLTALGADPAAWSGKPRAIVRFRHVLFPAVPEVGTIGDSNRGTYAQIVVLGKPKVTALSIITLGQSGFIRLQPPATPVLDPHFSDQLDRYRNFQYKPAPLYLNAELRE